MANFKQKVHQVVKQIPPGQTLTYGQVARAAGSPRAYRAVGSILAGNYDPQIPCHRVVLSDGSVGNYNRGGAIVKAKLLAAEKERGSRSESSVVCRRAAPRTKLARSRAPQRVEEELWLNSD